MMIATITMEDFLEGGFLGSIYIIVI